MSQSSTIRFICVCVCGGGELTVTAATDVPLLALSETTTKMQERKKIIYVNPEDKSAKKGKDHTNCFCNSPVKCQIKNCVLSK